ncbi:MAG: ferrous iron transport protein A [Erysipelotrichaceae bacterium]|nr:ferrous iron transport protein A [Erysipelotrichaceae bacterium]
MKLNELKRGQSARVTSISATAAAKRRLMEMGFTRNTVVVMKKVAPLGDPLELHVRGYELSIRKKDAAVINVEAI